MAITEAPTRAMSNVTVSYNGNDITGACDSAQLAAVVEEVETTTLASTAKESSPGATEWSIECSGPWSEQLDTYLGPDVVTPPTTKRTAIIAFGTTPNKVTYTFTNGAFISNYTIDPSSPSEMIQWSGTLNLSVAPVRAVS